jgi:hypothetical protein
MRFFSVVPRSVKGVNMGRHGLLLRAAVDAGALGDPVLVALDVLPVAQAQVLVADALAAREQGIGELLRRQVDVARDVLEPLGRIARGVLDLEHFDAAHRLVLAQGRRRSCGLRPMQRASSIESSSASLVPEPTEKCAVCARRPSARPARGRCGAPRCADRRAGT